MAAVRQHPHRLGRDGNPNGSAIESKRLTDAVPRVYLSAMPTSEE